MRKIARLSDKKRAELFRNTADRIKLHNALVETINEQISNAFVRLHKPFRQKSTILMVDFCHLP